MGTFFAGDTALEVGTALARADLTDRQSFADSVEIVKRYCRAKMKKTKTLAVALPGGKLETLEKKYAPLGYQDVFYLTRLDLKFPASSIPLPRPSSPVRRRLVQANFPLPVEYTISSKEGTPTTSPVASPVLSLRPLEVGGGSSNGTPPLAPHKPPHPQRRGSAASSAHHHTSNTNTNTTTNNNGLGLRSPALAGAPGYASEKSIPYPGHAHASATMATARGQHNTNHKHAAYPYANTRANASVDTTNTSRSRGTDASSDLLPEDMPSPDLADDGSSIFLPSPALAPRTMPAPGAPANGTTSDFYDADARSPHTFTTNSRAGQWHPPVPPPPGRPPGVPRVQYVAPPSVSLSPLVQPTSPILVHSPASPLALFSLPSPSSRPATAAGGPSRPLSVEKGDMGIDADIRALFDALPPEHQALARRRLAEQTLEAQRRAEEALAAKRAAEAEALARQRERDEASRRAAVQLLAAQTLGSSPRSAAEEEAVLDPASPTMRGRGGASGGAGAGASGGAKTDEDVRRMIEARIAALQTALSSMGDDPVEALANNSPRMLPSPPGGHHAVPSPALPPSSQSLVGRSPSLSAASHHSYNVRSNSRAGSSPTTSTAAPRVSSSSSTTSAPRLPLPVSLRAQPSLFMDMEDLHEDDEDDQHGHETDGDVDVDVDVDNDTDHPPPPLTPLTPSPTASGHFPLFLRRGSSANTLRNNAHKNEPRTPPPEYNEHPSPVGVGAVSFAAGFAVSGGGGAGQGQGQGRPQGMYGGRI